MCTEARCQQTKPKLAVLDEELTEEELAEEFDDEADDGRGLSTEQVSIAVTKT